MKLYAVTKGDYSEYHIIGLTASKKKAEFWAKAYSDKWGKATVEEFEDGEEFDNRLMYEVNIHKDYGVRVYLQEYCGGVERIKEYKDGDVCVWVLAEDKAKAVKIACDRRAKYLAEKAGL